MAQGDIYRLEVNLATEGQHHSFDLHYREKVATSLVNDGSGLSDGWIPLHSFAMRGCLSDLTHLESVRAVRIAPGPGMPGTSIPTTAPGSRGTTPSPIINALVFNLQQEDDDARHNGRIYLSGVDMSDHTGNEFNADYLGDQAATFLAALLADVGAPSPDPGVWEPVIVSKYKNTLPRPQTLYFKVTGGRVNAQVLSQRPRKSRVIGTRV